MITVTNYSKKHKRNINDSIITISVLNVSHYSEMSLNCLAEGAKSLLIEEAGPEVTPSICKLSAVAFVER